MTQSRQSPASTFVHQLRAHAQQRPDRRAFLYLERGEVESAELSFAQLDQRARAVAASLQGQVAPGERVLLLCPQGLDFISAFFGCLYAGVIAVPAYPPRANHHLLRIRAIAQDSEPRAVLATRKVLGTSSATLREIPELAAVAMIPVDQVDLTVAGDWRLPQVGPDSLALLQYTSGSTGVPRGVMVSHGNLLHNEELIREGYAHTDEAVIVSWLPLFHDMGLIGSALQAAYLGVPCILMSPVDFIQKPVRWLQAVSRYRATSSGGPNFAYDHCVRRVSPEQCQGLDLSAWKAAFSGSEPVRSLTLQRFAEVFSAYGFGKESFYPCYGLAEATLFVTGTTVGQAPVLREVDAEGLGAHQVRPAAGAAERAALVGCGHPRGDLRVEIVDPATRLRCPADQVGEVWVSGPSVARGYWKRPEATEETFGATLADDTNTRFLRTGDLGFIDQGSLFVTGRLKDLIILRGRNHYPQDIERTVEQSHASLRAGCGAAFSVDVDGEERLVVVQEVEQPNRVDVEGVSRAIRRAVSQHHEIAPHAVVLIRPATLMKTSSGKVQRRACKATYLKGELKTVGVSVLAQEDALSTEVAPLSRAALLEQPTGARRAFLLERLRHQVARVLRVTPGDLGKDQPLTALGVDSLSIVELKNELEAALTLSLPHSFFLREDVSLEMLAERVLASLDEAPSVELAPEREDSREVFPCTYGQQALLFEQQWAPQSTAYNVSVAARVHSQLDVPAFQRAIEHLLRRHPVLRTTYELAGSEWVQRIHTGQALPLRHQDVSTWTPEARVAWLEEQAHTPFDLARGPVFRVELLSARRDEHLLLLVAHHVAVDMWSLVVMLDELSQLYPAECARGETPLKPLPAGYEDFVRWQAARLAGPEGARDQAYWKERLSGQLPVLALPTDRVRPRVWSARGSKYSFSLPADLTERLQTLSRAQGATLYTTLLAAYQALLHRYTGQEELVIGSPASGRSRAEFEDVVGYFVNPVAIRTRCEASTGWQTLLARTRQAVLEALDHQDHPHPLLVQQLGLARDSSRAPLFQTMFAVLKPPREHGAALGTFLLGEGGGRVDLGGLELESIHLGQRAAQFDLCLTLVEQGNRLLGSFEFCTDLFERETIVAMAGHFQRLLESLTGNPAAPLSRLELLTGEQKAALVRQGWQPVHPPRELGVHALLEHQARQRPHAVALVSGTRRLTYAEFDARANQLAHTLRARGLRRGDVVAILLEREFDALVAMMGVMKAGGAFLPLDAAAPPERLAAMLEAASITTLLTRRRWMDVLPSTHVTFLDLDAEAENITRAPVESPGALVSPEDPAYVIYTSGTTGRPKGVMVAHGSVLNAAYVWRDYYQLEQQEAVSLQLSSFAFDIFIGDLMKVLISGGRLVICPEEARADLPAIAALIDRERISFLDAAPSLVLALLEEGLRQQWPLASLKVVILGGEAIDLERFRALHERLGARLRLVAAFGITETTVDSSCYELSGPGVPTGSSGYVPLGRPLPGTRFYILDEHLSPQPPGVMGELYIAGPGVALGYLEQPVLTSERFLPDPFFPGERMYRTGDLARWLGEGVAEFRGRGDHQVKIRGFRVETGDIEANLLQHPAVAQAVVVAWEDAQRTWRLAAYVASRENVPLDIEALRAHLRGRLPEYMVPSALLQLPALPLTPNGKVDRKALPRPDPAQAGGRPAYAAPTGPLEQQLVSIWSELLRVERVGIHDSFFELGGHSLLATQLVSRLREALQVELPLRTLFETPTVAELAHAVARLQEQSGQGGPEPVLKRATEDAAALLDRLDELSEEELDQLLAREGLK
ncbi:non-ribosomal peptide synthetase [Cystobacter fuscus]|uniref:Non-ribosomal peptide synthetase n=1 Tax=Cystobacter fuscus TaxID=43 RepID=A0A250JB36_9BACT|nr:non-ribosomal peptide synthetase [Cystobacter fuscus]ATB41115.1 non-ribosomal peptide synthetase [Cystobacter fuscus]